MNNLRPTIFAFDFSMAKPAMCALVNDSISFYVWPAHIDDKTIEILSSAEINVIHRNIPTIKSKEYNETTLIVEHVNRAINLSKLIVTTIMSIIKSNKIQQKDCIIANEGFAFNASGDSALDLSGYKYILMKDLIEKGFTNFKTYSPTAIKSTAECNKRGMGKLEMITAFSNQKPMHKIISMLHNTPQTLKKKTNFVPCIDDIADAYWCLRTTIKKENIDGCDL